MSKKMPSDPLSTLQLTEEEQALEDALAQEKYENDPDFTQTELLLREAAGQYGVLHSSKPVTIRLNQMDLLKIKAKAKDHDLPYQTLISSIIHEYAEEKRHIRL